METEQFDAESWAEEGINDAKDNPAFEQTYQDTAPPDDETPAEEEKVDAAQQQETPAEEKKAEETEAKVSDSAIAKLLKGEKPEKEEPGQRVPVEDHIKLRKRAQIAEQELEELKRQLAEKATRTEGEISGDQLAELDEDDLVRAGQARQAINKIVDAKISKLTQELEAKAVQEKNIQQQATRALADEKTVIASTADYKQVTDAAIELGLITEQDRVDMFKAETPAKFLYDLSKQKLTKIRGLLGIETTATTPTKETPKTGETPPEENPEEEMTDDQILGEIYG